MLIAGRVLQGIGGALMVPGSLALLAAHFPPQHRGKAVGLWSASTGVMVALAPALGGWIVHASSWRWVFLINLPLAAVALLILGARVPESRSRHGRKLDLRGAALATGGLGGITFGLIEAGRHSFLDPWVGAPILFGVLALALFISLEALSEQPMIPLGLFRRPVFAGIQAYTFLLWAAIQGALFFVPFRLMQVQGFGPLEAGTALLPFVIVASTLSRWAGGMVDRLGARGPLRGAGHGRGPECRGARACRHRFGGKQHGRPGWRAHRDCRIRPGARRAIRSIPRSFARGSRLAGPGGRGTDARTRQARRG
jgi:MFS family permease